MQNPEEIKKLAYLRLEEADILCQVGKYDGAFYLAGYSIELMLKAKICNYFGINNLFDFNDNKISHGVSNVRKALKTHDITVLFMLSGLKPKFDKAKSEKMILLKTNALLFEGSGKCSWNEQLRYQLNSQNSDKVKDLIDLLKRDDGLLKWIENE